MKKSETIGYSENNKPLLVQYCNYKEPSSSSSVRILILAGQHGDENCAKKSVLKLGSYLNRRSLEDIEVAVLSDANPDGSSLHNRRNVKNIDLNRDHQLLQSSEVKAIHRFVAKWKPHVILDVHNYPTRRKELLKKNLILDHDIFFDIPTNPAICPKLDSKSLQKFFSSVILKLEKKGIAAERYVLLNQNRARHSNTDLKDARNSLALKFDIFTVLIEGKECSKGKEKQAINSQYNALKVILKWIRTNKKILTKTRKKDTANQIVPIRARYAEDYSSNGLAMTFKNSITKKHCSIVIPKYLSDIEITKFVTLPTQYGIPKNNTKLISLLKQHGYSIKTMTKSRVQTYNNASGRIKLYEKSIDLGKYYSVSTNQRGSRFLAVLLEPESKYGLCRYPQFSLKFLKGEYPVIKC